MSNYYCTLCRKFQTKDGVDKVMEHVKQAHGITIEEGRIEHVGMQG